MSHGYLADRSIGWLADMLISWHIDWLPVCFFDADRLFFIFPVCWWSVGSKKKLDIAFHIFIVSDLGFLGCKMILMHWQPLPMRNQTSRMMTSVRVARFETISIKYCVNSACSSRQHIFLILRMNSGWFDYCRSLSRPQTNQGHLNQDSLHRFAEWKRKTILHLNLIMDENHYH